MPQVCNKCKYPIRQLFTSLYCECDSDWWCSRCGKIVPLYDDTKGRYSLPHCAICREIARKAVEVTIDQQVRESWDEITQEIDLDWRMLDDKATDLCVHNWVGHYLPKKAFEYRCSLCGKVA